VIVGLGDFLEVMEEGAGSLVCCHLFQGSLNGVVVLMVAESRMW